MYPRNKFSKSAGLIVITKDKKVVLIRRVLPYCYENFFYKRKIKPITLEKSMVYIDKFKKEYLSGLSPIEQRDFINFYEGNGKCEDLFDFPHGQIKNSKKITRCNMYEHKKLLFKTAMQEFEEETGYTFDNDTELEDKKILLVEFRANDDYIYTQFYFKITDVDLKPYMGKKESQYITHLIPIEEARRILREQQNVKTDRKHILLYN
jgi:hypothetical protein